MGSSKARKIDLGPDFGDVIVTVNGTQIEISSDGTIHGLPAPANDAGPKGKTARQIGDKMEDGTIYAGTSPDTHKPMYVRPKDEFGTFTFNEAANHAKHLDVHGHDDWRVPSKYELNVLWENRDKGKLKGTFNESGSYPDGHYWSSSTHHLTSLSAFAQRFSNGSPLSFTGSSHSSLRLVR